MLVSDFDYHLPPDLIAQEPAPTRDGSRLLVINRRTGALIDTTFQNLPEFLQAGDVLVVNNSRVFPARLLGRVLRTNESGSLAESPKSLAELPKIEVFLVRRIAPLVWEALTKPGRVARIGTRIAFAADAILSQDTSVPPLVGEVVQWLPNGRRVVRFEASEADFEALVDRVGRTPLPPYIKRSEQLRLDSERYQTVYAKERGSIAAPTAGLHFSEGVLDRVRDRGVQIAEITLHVGYGTFQPVRSESVEDHRVESELYSISRDAADLLNRALTEGRRVIAVGTTTTRALESAVAAQPDVSAIGNQESKAAAELGVGSIRKPISGALPRFHPGSSSTELFIYPGYEFRVVSGLVTNFHLPQSSLLMLVSALGGEDLIMKAYRHAVEQRYRFYSYGDAMLIL